MSILPFLLGASIAATPFPHTAHPLLPQPTQAAPHYPALWVVNDDDTIIYLFGTFHALDGRSNWFGQAVRTAFFASDQLMLETLVPRKTALPAPLATGSMPMSGGAIPVAQLAPSASFLSTTKMVMSAGRSRGLSTDRGADAVLRNVADQYGKPVAGLESFQAQLGMFRSLPPQAQPAAPAQTEQSVRQLAAMLSHLEAGWARGDVEATFAPLLRQMQSDSPQTYRTLFVDRNVRWADWIADRLKTPGTVFVAVGAGHLSGPDSVQRQLATRGVKSARIN